MVRIIWSLIWSFIVKVIIIVTTIITVEGKAKNHEFLAVYYFLNSITDK